ncbi:ATP-dependent DNA helicase Q-like 1 isoform C [Glycine soja]|uniref:ATP-dependent DNA helicase Q-like 1 isoform C n=1 Tax=Glycine soja TaxID=3848 RepID=A0A445JBL0_GLYSO|nr:ATP-dependent DNA helicase Q-like 1 isoform C [Glycine soja]
MSKSIESYYQESGRAGRDNFSSVCIALHQKKDFSRVIRNGQGYKKESFKTAMAHIYAECRRQTLLKHFGESFDRRDCKYGSSPCDNCLKTVFKLVLRIESNEGIKRSERQTNSRKKPKAKQKKNKQMFDAMKPKKSPFTGSSFSFLRKDLHKEFQEQNPDIKSMYDIGKACGEKWKTMTFEELSFPEWTMARSGFQQGKLNTICLAPLKVCKPDPRLLKEFVVVKGLYSSRELDNGICGAVGIIGDRIGAARYRRMLLRRRRVGNNIRVVGCAASYACHCFHFP